MTIKKLWMIGLIIIIAGSFFNGQFVQHDVGGLAREGMRVVILAGIAVFVYGLIQKFRRK